MYNTTLIDLKQYNHMPDYKVKVRFENVGFFIVNADDRTQAREMVEKQCSMNTGVIHSTLPEDIVDWDFPMKADKFVIRVGHAPNAIKPTVINRNKRPSQEGVILWRKFQRACKDAWLTEGAGGPEIKAAHAALLEVEKEPGMSKVELISAAWKIHKASK